MQPENIIIRRRRKRWPPPTEPRLDESYTAPPDTILPSLPVLQFPSSSPDSGFTPRGPLTLEILGQTGESREENPEACPPPMLLAPQATNTSHEGQSITVHQFLQDTTKRPCRKYGRRNRFAAVKLGVCGSEGSSPSSISCSDESDVETPIPQGATPSAKTICKAARSTPARSRCLLYWDLFSTHSPGFRAYIHSSAVAFHHLAKPDSVVGNSDLQTAPSGCWRKFLYSKRLSGCHLSARQSSGSEHTGHARRLLWGHFIFRKKDAPYAWPEAGPGTILGWSL
ncbi:hypothetical protein EDB89DRAFT_2064082 [Lactarius sanguifluus]|nr:hypothetical protein EDB89DRAFT_2064082 [Lactarius sanguifluus]